VLRLHDDPDLRAHLIATGEQQAARFTRRAAAERLVEELLAL
jgi:hypothetical protein